MPIQIFAGIALAAAVLGLSAPPAAAYPPMTRTFDNVTVPAPAGATPKSVAKAYCVSQGLSHATAYHLGLQRSGGRPSLFYTSIVCALIPL